MDKKQFLTIMAGLKSNYPNWKMDLTDKVILNFWFNNLKDIPYEIAEIGLRKLLAEEEFYPNIAKIRKACASVTQTPATDSTDGWGLVQKAIRRYGYVRADEAIESLPNDVGQAVVRMGGFLALCESSNVEADRAHFYRAMDQIGAREKSNSVLSLDLKQAIEQHQISSGSIKQIEEVINRKPLLEIDTTEIKYDESESIGDILRRELA